MFSPRTHRRQNSAETSYQKGKSPSSLPTVFFSLPRFIHCCYRRRGNFLAATARRGTKLFFLFFCICCCATRKETIFHTFHRWIRSGIILFTNGFSRMEFHSLIFPCCSSYLCTSATNCIFESYQRAREVEKLVIDSSGWQARLDGFYYTNDGIYLARISCESAWIMRIYEKKRGYATGHGADREE